METGIYAHYRRLGMLPAILGGALPQPINAPPGPSMGPQPIMGGNARNPALGAVPFPGQQWKSAGPLAVPQALPPPKGRGFLGAIDDVFGGPDMKNLTPEQQKAARRRGLLAFGAQMLTATDPRGNRAQGLSALGQGVMAAQGGYGQGIEQGMAQNAAQQEAQMWAQLQPQPGETLQQTYARLQSMLWEATRSGNKAAVGPIATALDRAGMLMRQDDQRLTPWEKAGFTTREDYLSFTRAEAQARDIGGGGGTDRLPAHIVLLNKQVDQAESMVNKLLSVEPRPPTNPMTGVIDPAGMEAYRGRVATWQKRLAEAQQRLERLIATQEQAAGGLSGYPKMAPPPAAPPPPPEQPGLRNYSPTNPFAR